MAEEAQEQSGLQSAVDHMRKTAQWLLAAFAAVGAAAAAGLTLSSIGAIPRGIELAVAALGLLLIALGVAGAIVATARVVVIEPISLSKLSELKRGHLEAYDKVANDQLIWSPAEKLDEVPQKVGRVQREAERAWQEYQSADEGEKAEALQNYQGAKAEADLWTAASQRALHALRFYVVHERYKKLVWKLAVAFAAAIAGGVLFAWAAGAPVKSTRMVVLPPTPTEVMVTNMTNDFRRKLSDVGAGERCPRIEPLQAVALAARGATYTIAVASQEGCVPVILDVEAGVEASVGLPPSE